MEATPAIRMAMADMNMWRCPEARRTEKNIETCWPRRAYPIAQIIAIPGLDISVIEAVRVECHRHRKKMRRSVTAFVLRSWSVKLRDELKPFHRSLETILHGTRFALELPP